MLNQDDLLYIGYIKRPHGFKGELNIELESRVALNPGDFLFVKLQDHHIPFPVESVRDKGQQTIISLRFVETYEYAHDLSANEIYLERAQIDEQEEPLLIGYILHDKELGELGEILAIEELPSQTMLVLSYKNEQIMIPLVEDFLEGIDQKNRSIHMILPEGILEQR